MDDETRERVDAAFENIGKAVRALIDHPAALEWLMRLDAGTVAIVVSRTEHALRADFVDNIDVGIVVRDPGTG